MTGERLLPNLTLINKWKPGTNGWGPGMDSDLQLIDTILQLGVLSRQLSAPPANPVAGNRFIVAASPTGAWANKANYIALFLDGAWAFYGPSAGWQCSVLDEDFVAYFDGTNWRARTEPYDVPIYRHTMPSLVSEPVMSMMMTRKVTFPQGFVVSRASCRVAATADYILSVMQNGSQVGTVTFPAGQTTGVFALAAQIVLAAGDVFELFATSIPDLTFRGLRITFAGNR